ncbi:MAG: hypothetical protein JSW15_11900 [Deltaproteobacteria bacterium]|jgi:hypothetical protein|nr:MAG: hypothetical protein JSW15_11900 [Deltaproteobacteria bacterium]
MVKKECFGILDKVFPVGNKGLREITPECFQCPDRTSCLKAALCTKEGLEMRAEILERAAASGMVGRFQRWSQKKELYRLMKEQREKKK